MTTQRLGAVLLIVGILLFLVAATADHLGFGQSPGLGGLQIGAMVVGAIVAAAGLLRLRSKST